jgi:hypothetical protein
MLDVSKTISSTVAEKGKAMLDKSKALPQEHENEKKTEESLRLAHEEENKGVVSATSLTRKYCSSCGLQLTLDDKFCSSCGNKIS